METRTLRIWDGMGEPVEYSGPYLEIYDGALCRIGWVWDQVKGRAVVFRQVLEAKDDYRPTDFVIDRDDAFEAWSNENPEPKMAFPNDCAPCNISEWAIRELTLGEREEFKRLSISIPPPSNEDYRRWKRKKECKAKGGRAKAQIPDNRKAEVWRHFKDNRAVFSKMGALDETAGWCNAQMKPFPKKVTRAGVRRIVDEYEKRETRSRL